VKTYLTPSAANPVADTVIISMLKQGDPAGWEYMYDKYASVIYGTLLKLTNDQALAEKILVKSFIGLKKTDLVTQKEKSLLLFLLHHTYTILISNLSAANKVLVEKKINSSDYPLISLLLFTPHSPGNIANKTGVAQIELRKNLKAESNRLRSAQAI
jgi:hypothetical protein